MTRKPLIELAVMKATKDGSFGVAMLLPHGAEAWGITEGLKSRAEAVREMARIRKALANSRRRCFAMGQLYNAIIAGK